MLKIPKHFCLFGCLCSNPMTCNLQDNFHFTTFQTGKNALTEHGKQSMLSKAFKVNVLINFYMININLNTLLF